MKKILSVLLALLMVIGLLAPMATAQGAPLELAAPPIQLVPLAELAEPTGEITPFVIVPGNAFLDYGQSQLFASSADPTITWSSADITIATVAPGGANNLAVVTGVGIGTTTITADVGGTPFGASVTVLPVVTMPSTYTLAVGDVQALTGVTIAPSTPAPSATLWTSTNTSVATVDPLTGVITAVAPGNTNIMLQNNIGGFPSGGTTWLTVTGTGTPYINVTPTSLSLIAGGSTATITAVGGYLAGAPITFTSSNPSIASVNASTGVVTPLSAGTVVITASATVGVTPVTAGSRTTLVTVSAGGTPVITSPNTLLPLGTTRPLEARVNNVIVPASWTITNWNPDDGVNNFVNGPSIILGNTLNAGTRPGWVTIRATYNSVNSPIQTIRLSATDALNVPTTTRANIPVNTSRQLEASVPGVFPQPAIFWSVSNWQMSGGQLTLGAVPPSISTVNNSLLLAGNRLGTFWLTASVPSRPDIAPVSFQVTVTSAHTVTFNLNGGTWPTTGLTQSTSTTFQQAINAVQANGTPRRLGFTFAGWWTLPTGGTQVVGTTPISASTTLWARWNAATNTTAVPANSTVASIFPDQNLAARVAASLSTTFNTTVSVNTRIFASDLATIQTLNLTRFVNQPIVDLRGIPTLTGVRTVTPANGLTNQNITLPAVPRTSPLNHTNVVRNRDGGFVNPTAISNNGSIQTTVPVNSVIRWTNVPATVSNLSYTWNVSNVLIGNQTVTFSGTATLPLRGTTSFIDVNNGHWFFNAVNFVVNNGYMEGTTANTFEPNRALTRAEVAVILYRMAGEPAVTGQPPFTDVTAAWQRNAVNWASRNGIVQGVGGNRFEPNRSVTRQEFAAMLHRFTVHNGVSVSVPGTANLNRFPDRADVSSWAVPYMVWATHRGLITGTSGGRLNPLGTTTRAECAQMIQRYATTIIW